MGANSLVAHMGIVHAVGQVYGHVDGKHPARCVHLVRCVLVQLRGQCVGREGRGSHGRYGAFGAVGAHRVADGHLTYLVLGDVAGRVAALHHQRSRHRVDQAPQHAHMKPASKHRSTAPSTIHTPGFDTRM